VLTWSLVTRSPFLPVLLDDVSEPLEAKSARKVLEQVLILHEGGYTVFEHVRAGNHSSARRGVVSSINTGVFPHLEKDDLMSDLLTRRRILTSGAAMTAAAALVAPSLASATSVAQAQTVVVRWNAKMRTWAARPARADFGVVFLSTNDPDATQPSDSNTRAGDVWRRHPDAPAT
jgi:hypothetical protein